MLFSRTRLCVVARVSVAIPVIVRRRFSSYAGAAPLALGTVLHPLRTLWNRFGRHSSGARFNSCRVGALLLSLPYWLAAQPDRIAAPINDQTELRLTGGLHPLA